MCGLGGWEDRPLSRGGQINVIPPGGGVTHVSGYRLCTRLLADASPCITQSVVGPCYFTLCTGSIPRTLQVKMPGSLDTYSLCVAHHYGNGLGRLYCLVRGSHVDPTD